MSELLVFMSTIGVMLLVFVCGARLVQSLTGRVCAAGYGMAAHSVMDTSREKPEYYRPPGHLGIRSSPLQLPVQQPQVGTPHTAGH